MMECPIPISQYPEVLLAHGGGGLLMHRLIEKIFMTAFQNPTLERRHDGALLELGVPSGDGGSRLAFTTDSYVVHPLFFPGGDIGALAVNGTVNDLAMCGARAQWLSAGFILEEGLSMETLWRVALSMRRAADAAGVSIVTGDTKVVDRGKADGLFINTAGIGLVRDGLCIGPAEVRAGDAVLVSGDLGRHGIAILSAREGLEFETTLESDCAPLLAPVHALLDAGIEVHCLRDLTRGGLSSALVEIAEASQLGITVEERAIPVREEVRAACELLGFDPMYVANEGRFVAFVAAHDAERAIAILRGSEASAVTIGRVHVEGAGRVSMKSAIGALRAVEMLSGEQLPRIC